MFSLDDDLAITFRSACVQCLRKGMVVGVRDPQDPNGKKLLAVMCLLPPGKKETILDSLLNVLRLGMPQWETGSGEWKNVKARYVPGDAFHQNILKSNMAGGKGNDLKASIFLRMCMASFSLNGFWFHTR